MSESQPDQLAEYHFLRQPISFFYSYLLLVYVYKLCPSRTSQKACFIFFEKIELLSGIYLITIPPFFYFFFIFLFFTLNKGFFQFIESTRLIFMLKYEVIGISPFIAFYQLLQIKNGGIIATKLAIHIHF